MVAGLSVRPVFYITDFRMSFCKGFTQGGSNADNVLTDAFIKGINPVSWSDGFQAIQKVGRMVCSDSH
jgi:Glycosyl hydrolase family 92